MKSRFRIPFVVFVACILLLSSVVMASTPENEAGSEPENGFFTYFPLVGSEFISRGFVRVAFDRYPDGTPIIADTILNGDEFSAAGILLAGAPTDSYCADATSTAILVPPHHVGGLDFTFLTSSRSDTSLGCNAVAVEITFEEAVSEVTVVFGGASVEYVLTAYDGADNELGVATQSAEVGAGVFDVTFDSGISNIKRVTFGHETAITAVTEVRYWR